MAIFGNFNPQNDSIALEYTQDLYDIAMEKSEGVISKIIQKIKDFLKKLKNIFKLKRNKLQKEVAESKSNATGGGSSYYKLNASAVENLSTVVGGLMIMMENLQDEGKLLDTKKKILYSLELYDKNPVVLDEIVQKNEDDIESYFNTLNGINGDVKILYGKIENIDRGLDFIEDNGSKELQKGLNDFQQFLVMVGKKFESVVMSIVKAGKRYNQNTSFKEFKL